MSNPFDSLLNAGVAIAIPIIGLATIAVIVSRNANTTNVISASSNGLATAIHAATAPVTGSTGFDFSNFGGLTGGGLPIG